MQITVEADSQANVQACWKAATTPEDIMVWNTASPEWHCPSAELDLRVGGTMKSRMEAVDGSMGFDFAATFTRVEAPNLLEYRLEDGRMVLLELQAKDQGTHIRQTFDAESQNDPEFQRAGWQSILDSFAKHA